MLFTLLLGPLCAIESATKGIPSSVFTCEYQSNIADNATTVSNVNETFMSGL